MSQSPGKRAARECLTKAGRRAESPEHGVTEICAPGTLTPPAPRDITVGNKDIQVQAAEI